MCLRMPPRSPAAHAASPSLTPRLIFSLSVPSGCWSRCLEFGVTVLGAACKSRGHTSLGRSASPGLASGQSSPFFPFRAVCPPSQHGIPDSFPPRWELARGAAYSLQRKLRNGGTGCQTVVHKCVRHIKSLALLVKQFTCYWLFLRCCGICFSLPNPLFQNTCNNSPSRCSRKTIKTSTPVWQQSSLQQSRMNKKTFTISSWA